MIKRNIDETIVNHINAFNKSKKIKFDLELRNRIVVIDGNSATGKTLLYKTLQKLKSNSSNVIENNCNDDYKNFEFFNYTSKDSIMSDLYNLKGKVIVIDNYDKLLEANEKLGTMIRNLSYDNQFIILGRNFYTLEIGLESIAEMQEKEKVFTLVYLV